MKGRGGEVRTTKKCLPMGLAALSRIVYSLDAIGERKTEPGIYGSTRTTPWRRWERASRCKPDGGHPLALHKTNSIENEINPGSRAQEQLNREEMNPGCRVQDQPNTNEQTAP